MKNPKLNPKIHSIKVTFDDGDIICTAINGTVQEIFDYYFGNSFLNSREENRIAVDVEFLD